MFSIFSFFSKPQPAAAVELPDTYSMDRAQKTVGEFRFKPGMDYSEWKQAARADLVRRLGIAEKLVAPRMELDPQIQWTREVANGTITKLSIQAEPDIRIPMYLCLPKGKGPFPVWICLQGHGSGMHVSIGVKWEDEKTFEADDGDRDFAVQCLEKGYAALCIEQRGFGERNCRSDRHYGDLRLAQNALLFGETMIGNRVFDIDRGIDFIMTRPELEHDRIGITGNSGGGTASIYAGAILDRLTHLMPSSCFSGYRESIVRLRHCPCNYVPGLLLWGDMGDLMGLCAPKALVIVNGKDDTSFPLDAAEREFAHGAEIYRAAGVPDRCRHVIGNAGHRFYKADAWPVMDEFFK